MNYESFFPIDFQITKINEQELFVKYKLGDSNAREILIYNNWLLVLDRLKKRFLNSTFDKGELFSVGTIGLIKAVDTFEINKGYTFSTYASACIDNEILMYLRKYKKEKANISESSISCFEEQSNFLETIASEEKIDEDYLQKALYSDIQKIVAGLPEKERFILERYFGINCEPIYLKDIASALHIPSSHASKIKTRALNKVETKLYEYGYEDLGFPRKKIKGAKKDGKR